MGAAEIWMSAESKPKGCFHKQHFALSEELLTLRWGGVQSDKKYARKQLWETAPISLNFFPNLSFKLLLHLVGVRGIKTSHTKQTGVCNIVWISKCEGSGLHGVHRRAVWGTAVKDRLCQSALTITTAVDCQSV